MGGTLNEHIREYRLMKEKQYAGYRVLLESALEAGRLAAAAFGDRPAAQRRRGAVWVQLADGRSSFARFLRAEEVPGWQRGSRKMGTYLPVSFPDLDRSLAWAAAFSDVLAGGDVAVAVQHNVISGPEGG